MMKPAYQNPSVHAGGRSPSLIVMLFYGAR
jgi:hypothetical protein